MATLLEQRSQQLIYLGAQHVFGRNQMRADTRLDSPDAAQSHASIHWNGSEWTITDHSLSGTLINDVAITAHTPVALAVGQVLRLGVRATQSFRVLDLAAPCPMLLPLGHAQAAIVLDSQHFLPNPSAPQVMIRRDAQGQWLWQDVHGCTVLQDGDTMQVAGCDWLFFDKPLPVATQPTLATPRDGPAQFNFTVSQNEEHVQLAVTANDIHIDLGERSHHYSLLTLARRRFFDAQQGFDQLSQGWIPTDRFAAMLGVEAQHANMLLHRARLQLGKQCPAHVPFFQCVERRRGEVRFGSFGFRIMRGSTVEAVFRTE